MIDHLILIEIQETTEVQDIQMMTEVQDIPEIMIENKQL
jgi:hypothetical protein